MRVDELERSDADAVDPHARATSIPPASCSPASAATALSAWLRERDAIVIEDDYDAEYRYDRAAVGALQGLEPDHVVYAGTVSKTLAPRCGWAGSWSRPAGRARRAREGARRPRDRPHRAVRLRRLPRARRARPPPAPHARALPRPPRRARRGARRGAAGGDGARHRRRPARDGRAADGRRRAGDRARRPPAAGIEIETMGEFRTSRRQRPAHAACSATRRCPKPAIQAGVRELAEAVRAVRERAPAHAVR